MTDKIKKLVFALLYFVFPFITSYLLPIDLLFIFNLLKGPINNPDGAIFIIPSLFALIIKITIMIVMILNITKKTSHTKYAWVLFVLLIIGIVIGTLTTLSNYEILIEDWGGFGRIFGNL